MTDFSCNLALVIAELQEAVKATKGAIQYFAVQTAPDGWLKADGSAVSRTDYTDLFAVIGTTFGEGDGSTTFNLPDLRGEFVRGYDNGRGVDSNRVFGSSQLDAFQGHRHSVLYTGNFYGGGEGTPYGGNPNPGYAVGEPITDGTNGTPRTASETRPRNVALLACIKY